MMKALRLAWVSCVALSAATGCGDSQDPAGADALWQRIHAENYRGFARAPGYETRKPAASPHSDQVDIYINGVIDDALKAAKPLASWPVGSLIVKDGFEDSGTQELVAVMDKRADGWFYAEYFDLANGEAEFSGQPATCLNCHVDGNDHVNAFARP